MKIRREMTKIVKIVVFFGNLKWVKDAAYTSSGRSMMVRGSPFQIKNPGYHSESVLRVCCNSGLGKCVTLWKTRFPGLFHANFSFENYFAMKKSLFLKLCSVEFLIWIPTKLGFRLHNIKSSAYQRISQQIYTHFGLFISESRTCSLGA